MFVFLMESASWFAWPGNAIASVQVLMTRMIDFRMSLAVNSLLFFSFTKSFVTWVMAMVSFSTIVWIFWKRTVKWGDIEQRGDVEQSYLFHRNSLISVYNSPVARCLRFRSVTEGFCSPGGGDGFGPQPPPPPRKKNKFFFLNVPTIFDVFFV